MIEEQLEEIINLDEVISKLVHETQSPPKFDLGSDQVEKFALITSFTYKTHKGKGAVS
jgi:hypothetical protein